jgi:hypothetical protein
MAEKIKQGEESSFTPARIDPEDVKKALKDFPLSVQQERGSQPPEPRLYKGACKVCGGDVTEKIVQEYNPMTGPPIIGPGSRQQYRYVSKGLYCKQCGIRYEFVPGEDQEGKQ